jgi:hypothetical protein
MENISVSGARVRIRRNLSGIIHPENACSLLKCHIPALSYSRHASQVKHLDSTAIGIQFLFLEDEGRLRIVPLNQKAGSVHSDAPAAERKSAAGSLEGK